MEEGKICRTNPESSDQVKAVHMLLVSYPLQGHITPFIKLAYLIAGRGIMATLVITEFAHARMIASEPDLGNERNKVRYITVPDGLSEDERNDDVKLSQSISEVMPGHLREVIEKVNMEGNQVTCVIADPMFGWAFEIAETMKLKLAIFWTSAPGVLALILSIPKLIEDGIIDTKGSSKLDGKIQLSPDLPPLTSADFLWNYSGNQTPAEIMFQYFFGIHQNLKRSGWLLCNWFHELNPLVGNLVPNMFPVGPLLASGKPAANLWPEDLTCLSWLNKQPAGSVIYVAFGSITVLSQHQMDELALGLELVGRPFLWVKRSDLIKGGSSKYPDGYEERVANRGKIVQWAPQEQVLAHPSIACFLTHCGWNSTMDGLSMGVPFLCWPYFADQFYNRSCICNGYKVGLALSPDEYGIVTRHEIRRKLDSLVADDGIKVNALKLKDMAHRSISEGGFSARYLDNFIQQMKE
ncbi:UDP-glycosyltransferase 83A1-like [Argentina anserina]|uniref:UDP-glycosyltransferase 83A1-like n=1 Tax=Argentina anserina TaxID=57926 RepID=UPI002176554E|nr:UDP-glycosyltransferase 83A1-like [Potentilla anserina]